MNDFEQTISKFVAEGEELQKKEMALRAETDLYSQKWVGFMKASGLPENFTIAHVALLAIKKSRELVLA